MAKKAKTATPSPLTNREINEALQVFALLSDDSRVSILLALAAAESGEMHVTDLCSVVGKAQPATSHHLALLRVSGLIESRREGKHNFYSIRKESFEGILKFIKVFTSGEGEAEAEAA